ncbi:MAG: DUF1659 domain-containing protein [Tissierellia bacterium]|nr:DUF1659 domain-containing protein [Tissierellia bacterium]
MAVVDVKENVRLKLELDGGMDGNRQIIKSKTFTKVKPTAENEDIYEVAESLADLQAYPIYKVKRLEEIHLVRE